MNHIRNTVLVAALIEVLFVAAALILRVFEVVPQDKLVDALVKISLAVLVLTVLMVIVNLIRDNVQK